MKPETSNYADNANVLRAVLILLCLCCMWNTPAESQTIVQLPFNTQTVGSMAAEETVIYEITLSAPGRVTIALTGWLNTLNWGTDYDRLYIYNSEGIAINRNTLSSEEDPFLAHMMSDPDTIFADMGMAGTYRIHLHSGAPYDWPEGVTSQSYTITATFEDVYDTHENNGSLETATTLAIGEQVTAYQWTPVNTSAVYGDEDWYNISVPSPGILTLHHSGWESTYNWGADYDRIYMHDSDGTMFDANGEEEYIAHMFAANDSLVVYLSDGGEYFLNFHAGAGSQMTPYTLQASFVPCSDQFEPNDTVADAAAVEHGGEYTAYQWKSLEQGPYVYGDEDYYTFQMNEAGDVTVSVSNWESTYNWGADYDRIYLYHADGSAEGGVVEDFTQHMIGASNPYSKTFALVPGTYYVRLHSGAGIGSGGYTISIDYPDSPVAVEAEEKNPHVFAVSQPYPNPFNPTTTLQYELAEAGNVTISVFNSVGQQVLSHDAGYQTPGAHSYVFDASHLTTGSYFYRVESGANHAAGKMLYMK
jgi:hypothetical protein